MHKNELIRLTDASKYYGPYPVFGSVVLSITRGERVTIVGENGSGKSTLLRLLARKTRPTQGEVCHREGLSIGYLPQALSIKESIRTVLECMAEKIPELSSLVKGLTIEDKLNIKHNKSLLHEFNRLGGYKIRKILSGLGIAHIPLTQRLDQMSGGESARIVLASLLLQEPDVLILDEPTNHLDQAALITLESYLKQLSSSIVLVTHDRALLNTITRRIIEIDSTTKQLSSFNGTYERFLKDKLRKQVAALQTYAQLKVEEKIVKAKMSKQASTLNDKPPRKDRDKISYHAGQQRVQLGTGKKIKQGRRRLEEVSQLTESKPPELKQFSWTLASQIKDSHHEGEPMVFRFEGVSKKINNQFIIENCSGVIQTGQKIVLQGANGSGKTTLLRILMSEISADAGTVWLSPHVKVGYLPQLNPMQNPHTTVLEEIRGVELSEADALTVLRDYCLFEPEFADKKMGELSIGQQRRIQLAKILIQNPHFLMLDEPTNHLDYINCEYLESQLLAFKGTVLAVSHDRYFIQKLNFDIWQLSEGTLNKQVEWILV